MSDLNIIRKHQLSLVKAREIAQQWVTSAENDYRMACSCDSTEVKDIHSFQRKGVSGTLEVNAEQFELNAKLGFLFKSFKPKIEEQINKNLDELLGV